MTVCRDPRGRRKAIREHRPELNGIDYVEVAESQKLLTIYFLGPVPQNVSKANFRIDGGRRVRGIRVTGIHRCRPDDPRTDGCVQLEVDRPGDFSTYTLRIVEADANGRPGQQPLKGFDPRYAQIEFTFKAACPTTLDCAPRDDCPPEALDEPDIDYLAKDYAAFRQLILDRLSLIMPDWKERHVPDVGIALVELLAYAGDTLSYYQDAVATEAYLETARQRISVRRHATLVNYRMHDGSNARAWVCIETDTDGALGDAYFVVPLDRDLARRLPPVIGTDDLRTVPFAHYEVFESIGEQSQKRLFAAHNWIRFYTWGDRECCLPRGATAATLIDEWIDDGVEDDPKDYAHQEYDYCPPPPPPDPRDRPRKLQLNAGDVLIFEEVVGPVTAEPADADMAHRHAVRLTRVEPAVDALYDQPVVEIAWAEEDALPFPLCISAIGRAPECRFLSDISVARGNVLLVDHGRHVGSTGIEPREEWPVPPLAEEDAVCLGEGEPREDIVPPPPFRPPALRVAPVTHASPFPAPRLVARRQAALLSGLLGEVRARVEELWRETCDGRALTTAELEEIHTIFGRSAFDASGLPGAATPCKALQYLLQRFDRLLAKKAHRVRVLAGRARAAYVMSDPEEQEVAEMFGARVAARLGLGSDMTFGPASRALVQDPADALPWIRVREAVEPRGEWTPKADLLDSGGEDAHFVAEIDNRGRAHARFGDGDRGRAPAPDSLLVPEYRAGNGTRGNVGAEAISRIVFRNVDAGRRLRVRNPLPAAGGTEPQPLVEAKLFAPVAFRTRLERAVTPDDYAQLAQGASPDHIQRAASPPFRWNGSWYEAHVAIDPLHTEDLDDALRADVEAHLYRYRRIGHDLRIVPADYVPLDLALVVCVQQQHLRAHVEAALLDVFSNRDSASGVRGFFHPDNLTFGAGVHLSRLVAAAQSVTGVESVKVTRLQRLFEAPNGEIEKGTLPVGPLEVARLANDRSFPEHGTLMLDVRGGR